MTDTQQILSLQLGRALRTPSEVVSECHLGLPVVAKVPPILDDGTPFPTLFWLTCPLARKRVGRLESIGGVKHMEKVSAADPEYGERLAKAHQRYAQQRQAMLPANSASQETAESQPVPTGGVGGTSQGVKCLHAHYADYRAGNDNPVGEAVARWVEPLDCAVACVIGGQLNPDWTEPK